MDPYAELVKLRNQRGIAVVNAARPWYRVENYSSPLQADIYIYDIIGADPFFGGVSAAAFVDELRGIAAKNITLHINSVGGDVFEGKAIRTALNAHPTNIDTSIDGIAGSTASWVGLGVRGKVTMTPQSNLMIHEPFYGLLGDSAVMRKAADELDMFGQQIAEMYQAKAGGTVDGWRDQMRAETWFTDKSAVSAGLADEIAGDAAPQNSVANLIESTFARLITGAPATPPAPVNVQPTQPDPDLVRSALIYQRDQSRRLGVA